MKSGACTIMFRTNSQFRATAAHGAPTASALPPAVPPKSAISAMQIRVSTARTVRTRVLLRSKEFGGNTDGAGAALRAAASGPGRWNAGASRFAFRYPRIPSSSKTSARARVTFWPRKRLEMPMDRSSP